ncbi:hypothetical protein VNO77_07007 [Canavalia gladiata]|uniref:C2 domain-containing protein n=1 Tax=Canavalia gladiata TaxID=3824 RepID=A0AAN9M8S7_CANGL
MATKAKARTLEITVLSAEDLRINGKAANNNVFVLVRAESLIGHTTTMKVSGGGGGFHSWNEKFLVKLGVHASSMTFEVKCKTTTGTKDIGVARIALKDFLGGLVPDSCLQFLSYRLIDWDGLRNGIVNFSVKMVTPETLVGGSCEIQKASPGVVIGIPIWWNNHRQ